jgi:predicted dithiol-disulfide oxidoreductase (DUF899 family)
MPILPVTLRQVTACVAIPLLRETAEGAQRPMLNVFRRDGEAIRHFWGSELLDAPTEPGQDPRHVDAIDPQWNLFDFTPQGRGIDWYPELSYS